MQAAMASVADMARSVFAPPADSRRLIVARCSSKAPREAASLGICETHTLPLALSIEDATAALKSFLLKLHAPASACGILRFQVPLPPSVKALHWLQSQPECPLLSPRIYFSPRNSLTSLTMEGDDYEHLDVSATTVAGAGSAVTFRGAEPFSMEHCKSVKRFLSEDSPFIRAYGAMRFDPHSQPSPEWEGFGAFYFFIPRVELCETGTYSLLAVNLTWGEIPIDKATETLLKTLNSMEVHIISSFKPIHVTSVSKSHSPDEPSWCANVRRILENIPDRITKAVMARQTKLELEGDVSLYTLLASLQEQSPSAYQFCLQLPDGTSFLGNTPEQLFAKNGLRVTSEAVAATRPRGATSVDDDLIALEMLQSCKDHTEFQIVEDGVKGAMESICKHVKMVMTKEILKQPTVQHLQTRLIGELDDNYEEYDILKALHPTPAVCGNPRINARATIGCTEAFDRGLYAGPFGWFGGQGAEFAVGIRSALIRYRRQDIKVLNGFPKAQGKLTNSIQEMYLYAGAGIVQGSDASSEWQELETKTSQFEALLKPVKHLKDAANINMVWASIIVEECCRLGVTHFCVAPGSRSSPLAEAAAANPRVSCISCLDERALAFYAVGYGRGARKAAAVVTTSGTAVSNLLPAVVEASQDCVPLLVLSADLPHELRDTGWNQTINQVEHFGSFVRYHFDLPPATDEINVRMVLTTLDTAVFRATTDPCGPVHINCPYRQPLEASPKQWDSNCLEGLTRWMTNSHPFTTYISSGSSLSDTRVLGDIRAVRDIIVGARRGLIVVGGLNEAQTVWAVYKLAKHLRWPLVPDILSGLKLASMSDINIIYHLDHTLLSPSLSSSVAPDIILQIGSRITSKRLSLFMQNCCPDAHILVEQHPYRHDPPHRLTHRIKSSVSEFTNFLLKELKSELSETSYSLWLRELSETVGREITFQLRAENDLTEPGIAQIVSANIDRGSALFLGNSMPIRDMDMYADVQGRFSDQQGMLSSITVAANRGVNGIDGVLSSATGFAAGSNKRVTLLIGDISFLHDTNGLMLLNGREAQPPVTVVVVNNRGGGIFSLLPLATFVHSASTFRRLISTEHNVQLSKLCQAHSLMHIYVQSKDELSKALRIAHSSSSNYVIEVESNIHENAHFHRNMQKEICRHLDQAFPILSRQLCQTKNTIVDLELLAYRFPLKYPTTTSVTEPLCRKGFLLRITLSNGATGVGEVAPLPGLHEEDLLDVEEQLRLSQHKLRGAELPEKLALLNGAFSDWLLIYLGEQVHTIFPSVRCGLEMAALEALAASNKCSLWEILRGKQHTGECSFSQEHRPGSLDICGLLDSQGTPDEVAATAVQLVREGFTTLKIKVARRTSPLDDAAVIAAVRREAGRDIRLRVDANRRWTLLQAIQFAKAVEDYDLQYIEEPVNDLSGLPTFLEQSNVRVALDESIDENILQTIQTHDNIVAAVIKPCRVGGFENANFLARLARKRKMIPVISACFESSISLSAYAQFAAIVDQRGGEDALAHGLGTYTWTRNEDGLVKNSFSTFVNGATVSTAKAATVRPLLDSSNVIASAEPRVRGFTETATTGTYQFSFHILEVTIDRQEMKHEKPTTLVFLHGFLGTAEEWLPIMSALSSSFRCLAVDLPGHGKTSVSYVHQWGTEVLAEALAELLIQICSDNKVVVIGYSMGARIALAMSVRKHKQIEAAVIISGSPGLRDEALKKKRAAQDEELAERLRLGGLESFIASWYKRSMWRSLNHIPEFQTLKKAKVTMNAERVEDLAIALSRLSIGRQPCMWQLLEAADVPPLLLVAGQLDKKFSRIAQEMAQANSKFKLVLVEKTGHNVHVESPLCLIRILRRFVYETVCS